MAKLRSPAPPPPELATVIHLSLRERKLSPARLSRCLVPPPARGRPDPLAQKRRALARQLRALKGLRPAPADLELDPLIALGLDRVLGLPTGYCALVATLDSLLRCRPRRSRFLKRLPAPPTRLQLCTGFAVILPRGAHGSIAFVDRFGPAGSNRATTGARPAARKVPRRGKNVS